MCTDQNGVTKEATQSTANRLTRERREELEKTLHELHLQKGVTKEATQSATNRLIRERREELEKTLHELRLEIDKETKTVQEILNAINSADRDLDTLARVKYATQRAQLTAALNRAIERLLREPACETEIPREEARP